jgi:hypothetical protein
MTTESALEPFAGGHAFLPTTSGATMMTSFDPQDEKPDNMDLRRKDLEAKLQAVTARIAETTDAAIRMSLEKEAQEIRTELEGKA